MKTVITIEVEVSVEEFLHIAKVILKAQGDP